MAMAITICRFCMVVLLVVAQGRCAPRSKGGNGSGAYRSAVPQTVYDQKQTGDYNVQLHLKDFQIIAVLGDDYFGGDYDYNYDYSDFTLKPSTQKPTTAVTPSPPPNFSTSSIPEKPSSTPAPTTAASSSTSSPKEPPINEQEGSLTNNNEDKPTKPETNTNEVVKTPTNTTQEVVEIVESSTAPQREKYEETNSPGKIKVQIIETPVGVVPGEVFEKDGAVNHGEMVQLRRCSLGFARDKKGRCRRVRKPGSGSPQLPYGISRLANSLASRFRYTSSESVPSSESAED